MDPTLSVKEIMTKNIISVAPEDSFEKIQDLFQNNSFHHIPVLESNGKIVGIISKDNWLFSLKNIAAETAGKTWTQKYSKALTAGQVMTENPIVLSPDDSIGIAAEIFMANIFRALPIVEDDELQGLITTYDLLKYAYK